MTIAVDLGRKATKQTKNHTEEKPYDKSVHTGEEPYIYDFTIVRLINKPVSQNNPLSNLLVKINHFGHR